MSLTEEEMRQALFGPSTPAAPQPTALAVPSRSTASTRATPVANAKPRSRNKPLAPKLRVTLDVTRVFEGEVDVFVHDAATLSTFDAEQAATKAAKVAGYRYVEVVSVKAIE